MSDRDLNTIFNSTDGFTDISPEKESSIPESNKSVVSAKDIYT